MTTTTQPVTATLEIRGLPDSCPECGEQPVDATWTLAIHNLWLTVECPSCFLAICPVRAVAATDPECE